MGNRLRFRVRVARAGEAKLRGRANGMNPPLVRAPLGQKAAPPELGGGGRKCAAVVSRECPDWCPLVFRGVPRCPDGVPRVS
eukprot:9481349-Pyramimonas_sp.AAC.1